MFVSNLNSALAFCGIYEKVSSTIRVKGKAYFNKKVVITNQYLYHPFLNEKPEDITRAINKGNYIYKFALIEKDHFHTEGQYSLVQKVVLGERVKKSDAIKQKKFNNTEDLLSENYIHDTYNNYEYGVMDLQKVKS